MKFRPLNEINSSHQFSIELLPRKKRPKKRWNEKEIKLGLFWMAMSLLLKCTNEESIANYTFQTGQEVVARLAFFFKISKQFFIRKILVLLRASLSHSYSVCNRILSQNMLSYVSTGKRKSQLLHYLST